MQTPSGMDPRELMLTAARAAAVYVFMLIVIRALGKRTVGNFSAFDLLVALMLGEVVDEIIYGDVLFIQGTVAIVAIAALAYADSWLAYLRPSMEALLEGKPTIVVRDGRFERARHAQRADEREGRDGAPPRARAFTTCARSTSRSWSWTAPSAS